MIDFEYINKLRDLGYNWDEIQEQEGITDTTRKMFYGWKQAQDDLEKSTDKQILDKIAKQKQNIRLAKKQLSIERSINNEQIRDLTLRGHFDKQILSAMGKLPKLKYTSQVAEQGNKEHIITLADLHYTGEEDTLKQLERAYDKILQTIKENKIERLHLIELGDIIEGASLRTSQLMGIKTGMVEQTIKVAEAYAQMLDKLSKEVDLKFYSLDSSNHTQLRNMGTKQNELVEEDLMKVFNGYISSRLPALFMQTGKDLTIKLLGYQIYVAHGHLFRGENYINKLNTAKGRNYDFYFFGHFHHFSVKDLNVSKTYDRRLFFVPALTNQKTSYEEDRLLSSTSGIGYYEFESKKGNTKAQKITI